MSNFLFHNKFHRANHHTIATPGLPDSATDPIASQSEPFLGIFYNYQNALLDLSAVDVSYLETFLTDSITTFDGLSVNTIQSIYAAITANVFTNSKQWFEMYTNINTFSAFYGLYPTVSSTVNAFSGSWNLGYDFYSSLNTLSTNYFSTYTVVNTYSANWPFIDTTLRLNLVQQNTRSKNFSGARITDISVIGSNISAYWNLSAAQCAFFRITGDTVFKNIVNPNNKKKGGEYTLVLQQDGFGNRPVIFESDYVFSYSLSTFSLSSEKGYLFSVGANNTGQLGLGSFTDKSLFTAISSVSAAELNNRWTNIICGNTYAIAFSGDILFATGNNFNGQLGLGDTISRNIFTPLTGSWQEVVCGSSHTLALSTGTNKWYGTGNSLQGQLGLNISTNIYRLTPLSGEWQKLRTFGSSTFGLSGGIWYATGLNDRGQLGLGDSGAGTNRLSFTPLTGNWDEIVCGTSFTYALSNNVWYATGWNSEGQLGLGDTSDRNVFTPLTGSWDKIVCGSDYAFALSGGTWYAVGGNVYGQLGLGDSSRRVEFTPLTGDWSDILPGRGAFMATYALSSNGIVHSAGYNVNGQLGLGAFSGPVRTFTSLNQRWSKVSVAANSVYALLSTVEQVLSGIYLPRTEFVSPTALSVTVIRFTCDGNKLYGKPTFYYYERDTIWTYFAGDGLIFDPDPAEFYINDYFIPIQGLTVVGVVVPAQGYSDGGGIVVVDGLPS